MLLSALPAPAVNSRVHSEKPMATEYKIPTQEQPKEMAPSAPESAAQPDSQNREEPQDWKARYQGLDRKFQQEKSAWSQREGLFVNTAMELEKLRSEVAQRDNALKERDAQLQSIAAERENAQKAAATVEGQLKRLQTIAKVNPSLLEHETKGLLRTDLGGEDLEKYLSDFMGVLKGSAEQNLKAFAAGSTPSAPAMGKETPESIYAQIQKLMKEKKWSDAEELMPKYYEAQGLK